MTLTRLALGNPVRLGDVAAVERRLVDQMVVLTETDGPAIAINIQPEEGINILQVMENVREVARELEEGPLAREGLVMEQIQDETEYIGQSIAALRNNLLLGIALAVGILWWFLRRFKATLVIAAAITMSLLIAVGVVPTAAHSWLRHVNLHDPHRSWWERGTRFVMRATDTPRRRYSWIAGLVLTAESLLDQMRLNLQVARGDLVVAEARLRQVEDQISKMTIVAPFDGVVSERLINPGETINRLDEVIRLVSPESIEVTARAPLNAVAFLDTGSQLPIYNDYRRGTGTVRTIVTFGDPQSQRREHIGNI